jgi:hypothetical protein
MLRDHLENVGVTIEEFNLLSEEEQQKVFQRVLEQVNIEDIQDWL